MQKQLAGLAGRFGALAVRSAPVQAGAAASRRPVAFPRASGAWEPEAGTPRPTGLAGLRAAQAGGLLAGLRPAAARGFATTPVPRAGLDDFYVSRAEVDKDGNPTFPAVGRAWKASELREKSFEDLHKLWWICLKERNSLAGERHEARAKGMVMANPRRWRKIRKTMARIKVVLGERQRMRYTIEREKRAAEQLLEEQKQEQ